MLDGQIAILESAVMRYATTGQAPASLGNRHPSIAPFEPYATADRPLIIAAGNDVLFGRLCQALGRNALATDARFTTNSGRNRNVDALKLELEEVLRTEPAAHWVAVLEERGAEQCDSHRGGRGRAPAGTGPQHDRHRRRPTHGRNPVKLRRLRRSSQPATGPRSGWRRRTHPPGAPR